MTNQDIIERLEQIMKGAECNFAIEEIIGLIRDIKTFNQ